MTADPAPKACERPAAPPLPTLLKQGWHLVTACATDGWRFWRHSFTRGAETREQLRARIAIALHFLEYGLSLRESRAGRGSEKAGELIADLEQSVARWGHDAQTEIAAHALRAYLALNAGMQGAAEISRRLAALAPPETGLRGGAERVTRAEIQAVTAPVDFEAFAAARHSIRQYDPAPVPPESIARAARIAQQSPSSCNRQTCRLQVWTEPAAIARIAALQSGNRGFGHELGGLAIVWSDLNDWTAAGERMSGLVDGGMFAMSFLLGLHAEGLGAVTLNWSEEPAKDRALRALAGLPGTAQIVVMVGFGTLPETLSVPVSQRRPVAGCLTLNAPLAPL